jgi:hypothetical protein
MADTLVTLSNVGVKGKIIARLRKVKSTNQWCLEICFLGICSQLLSLQVIQRTSFQYSKTLIEHPAWIEIATLVRFTLMLTFHSSSPIKPYLADLLYIVTLLVATGPTVIRTSIHGMVVNILQLISTESPLSEGHIKKLHLLANDISDTTNRVLYGVVEENVNPFTISRDTLTDVSEPINLGSLEVIVKTLIEAMSLGASTIGM